MPDDMIEYLTDSLKLDSDDVYRFDGPLHIQDLMTLYDLDRP
jgi:polyphosphate kinase